MKYLFGALAIIVLLIIAGIVLFNNTINLPVFLMEFSPEVIEKDINFIPYIDRRTQLIGYKNRKGEIILPAAYVRAQDFNKYGIANVLRKEGNKDWFKINAKGDILVKSYFFDNGPDYYMSGLSRYVDKEKIGFIDRKAAIVIKAEYDWASFFSLNAPIAIVCKRCKEIPVLNGKGAKSEYPLMQGGEWGAIDKLGKIIAPLDYDAYEVSRENTVQFKKGKKCFNLYWDGKDNYKLSSHKCSARLE